MIYIQIRDVTDPHTYASRNCRLSDYHKIFFFFSSVTILSSPLFIRSFIYSFCVYPVSSSTRRYIYFITNIIHFLYILVDLFLSSDRYGNNNHKIYTTIIIINACHFFSCSSFININAHMKDSKCIYSNNSLVFLFLLQHINIYIYICLCVQSSLYMFYCFH